MRRPRSRGGTGLGLSICCKQVGGAVLCSGQCFCPSVLLLTWPLGWKLSGLSKQRWHQLVKLLC